MWSEKTNKYHRNVAQCFLKRRKECVCSFLLAVWRYCNITMKALLSSALCQLLALPGFPPPAPLPVVGWWLRFPEYLWCDVYNGLLWMTPCKEKIDTISVLGLQEFSFQTGPISWYHLMCPGISELWHNTCEINCLFLCGFFSPWPLWKDEWNWEDRQQMGSYWSTGGI